MGHELRNPLFSMSANLELLDTSGLDDDGRRSVAAATRGATRMRAVIDDMLTMAQVSDPHREFDPIPVDLRRVVHDVCDECHAAATAAGVSCGSDVPDEPVLVPGEPEELHRLLTNLVSNAIKYTDPGGRVTLRVATQGRTVVATVEDTGIGISPPDQEQLFREFFRSTNPAALVAPRHRARPGDRRADRRAPRRLDRHRLRAWARHDGDPDPAGPRRGRQRGPSSSVMKVLSGSST